MMKVLCQILKVNSFFDFRVAYRLSGTGVVECLEIIDVGCNLIQLDHLTGLTLADPHILHQIYAIIHWRF